MPHFLQTKFKKIFYTNSHYCSSCVLSYILNWDSPKSEIRQGCVTQSCRLISLFSLSLEIPNDLWESQLSLLKAHNSLHAFSLPKHFSHLHMN